MPRLLGVKEFGNLGDKVSKFQLDKNEDVGRIGVAPVQSLDPKSATGPGHCHGA